MLTVHRKKLCVSFAYELCVCAATMAATIVELKLRDKRSERVCCLAPLQVKAISNALGNRDCNKIQQIARAQRASWKPTESERSRLNMNAIKKDLYEDTLQPKVVPVK
jgi:hypothetical protein